MLSILIRRLDTIVGTLIIANSLIMFLQLTHYGHKAELDLGLISDGGVWPNADTWFSVLEHIFNAIFIIELGVRVSLMRNQWHTDASNWLDVFLVAATSLQLYVLGPMSVKAGGNLTIFRVLRIGRTVRVLRLVRVMKMFTELRVLLHTMILSGRALLWSMVFLFIIMIISSLFVCFALSDTIVDETITYDLRKWLYRYYGDGFRGTYTLFEVTFAGCWPTYFRPLIERVSVWYAAFVILYISAVVFAIIRIITALFLKNVLQVAAADANTIMCESLSKKQAYIKKLGSVFEAADVSGDGNLSGTEFQQVLLNPDVKQWLDYLELEVHDVEALFNLLDEDGSGEVSYQEFIDGVQRLKGQARSMDLIVMMRKMDIIGEMLLEVKATTEKQRNSKCSRLSLGAVQGIQEWDQWSI